MINFTGASTAAIATIERPRALVRPLAWDAVHGAHAVVSGSTVSTSTVGGASYATAAMRATGLRVAGLPQGSPPRGTPC